MIYMFLSPTDDLGENQLFMGQKFLQVCSYHTPVAANLRESKHVKPDDGACFPGSQIILLLLAVAAVPWMLFPKPFILKKQHEEVCLNFTLNSSLMSREVLLFV